MATMSCSLSSFYYVSIFSGTLCSIMVYTINSNIQLGNETQENCRKL